ncbi:MAG: GxxExxY protein [Bacteroidetes bacterium]|nr:GxxExxY protein [Bacteroidota bacterium]
MIKHQAITEKIIRGYYKVYNTLGYGFLEKVYEQALCLELRNQGLHASTQQEIEVYYEGSRVGLYYADLVVEHCVIVELKAAEGLAPEYEAQLLNYLKATDIEVGLLMNFGPKAQFKRMIFDNERKAIRDNPLDPRSSVAN